MRLEGMTAVITGGASGFGAEGVAVFAREGARVVVGDLDLDRAEAVVAEVASSGGEAVAVRADVTVEADCRRLAETAAESFGGIDVVWANAGLGVPDLSITDTSVELFRQVMEVNALGPWLTIREALPFLNEESSALITASLGGLRGRPLMSSYQASKGAAVMLARSLAIELAPRTRVNAICPLAADTPMMQTFLANREESHDEVLGAVAAAVPMARIAKPRDVALTALFVASKESGMLTGQAFPVDGGVTARA